MKMISDMLSYWDSEQLDLKGKRILCALSGGADSVAMVCLLAEAAKTQRLTLYAAHYNHGLRGEEADRDSRFAQDFCRQRGIPIAVGGGDVAAYAKENRMGFEQAARQLRYAFLQREAEQCGADYIATAHNADDNTETVLMHLLRGTGTRGLCGIPPRRDNIVRPVLCFTGRALRQYLTQQGIDHVEDSTNALDDCLRNRIRHHVMPLLRQLEPRVSDHVLTTSSLCRRDDACLDALARAYLDRGQVRAKSLCALERAVALRALRLWLGEDLSVKKAGSVLRLAENGVSGRRVELTGDRAVLLEQGTLTLISGRPLGLAPTTLAPGRNAVPGWEITLAPYTGGEIRQEPFRFFVKENQMPLGIRSRQTGDILNLPFRGGRKTVKKLLIDAKVPLSRRQSIPVLTCGGQAAAMPGFGISEEYRLHFGESGYIISFREV